ncbi:SAM-dependent methyltransferase [Actinoplanes couchii]|uniref:S-adenosyl methyltransferase n=1 Tax=Actinoplanes couchii TaxID=403638 RepID=A0ABQ3XN07_9ACTN|nr:SAM-dependent methyltransferase [Actinoplanes couchii]MDR6317917.1 hypothetical protein [Actinoplanes couchii]GID59904.1 hypothetical protein Aco03nite_083080 [Actinoplanes couchii]
MISPLGQDPDTSGSPIQLNTHVPHAARIYDYWLGGKDNFAPDRAVAAKIIQTVPTVTMMVRANRQWMCRAVTAMAREAGIRQFLDIGTGIPTKPNLHQCVQRIAPDSRIVYVDNDPLVLVHARALLTSNPEGRCAYLDADVRDVDAMLANAEVTDLLDLSQPVGIVCASVLMLLADREDPWKVTARLRDWAPAGSHLAISHPSADHDPAAMAAVMKTTGDVGLTFVPRTHEQVTAMFGDWQMLDPGLVPVSAWRPDEPLMGMPDAYYWAGVARKPTASAARLHDTLSPTRCRAP